MNELKFKWSMSTIKMFLDNGNPDITSEIMTNKEYLQKLVKKLRAEYKEMFLNNQEETTTGKKYFVAINEIEDWITNCH
jgi:predicted house-cleaning noncanonical NTP pyrophosphatase (MazG superfamily)